MSESVLLTDDHPVDPDDELLVAYLDNELEEDKRQVVEKRLVAEPPFRHRLQMLQTGWDWLDEIPSESIDEKLVESTIELVVSDIAPSQTERPNWFSKNRRLVGTVGVIVTAFGVGIAGTTFARRMTLEKQFADLAVAEELEAYSLGPDFKFFSQLATNPRWQAMAEAMQQISERSMEPQRVVESLPQETISEAIESLPSDQREKLLVKWNRFESFDESTKRELRQTATKVNSREERDSLLTTMKVASVWLEDLPDEMRDQIRSDDEALRTGAIEEAIQYTMAELSFDSGKLISESTSDRIFAWLEALFWERVDELPVEIAERIRNSQLQPNSNADFFKMVAMHQMLDDPDQRGRRRFGFGRNPLFSFRPDQPPSGDRPPPPPDDPDRSNRNDPNGRPESLRPRRVTNEEYNVLRNLLDKDALQTLDALTSYSTQFAGEAAVYTTLRTWAQESVRRHIAELRRQGDETTLERYLNYDKEDHRFGDDRDTLDLQPPAEIKKEIFDKRRFQSPR
ncbi:hypothetical protein LOC67_13730 [Stieleria sp. JC731]|uniref:anti-sigma factor family protein n=1 Tax=Pirellulaceae TaxID=2691357 RepID=UPI001E2F5C65|nr:hypothetical protein [Stieleria sp. JC731]MCC9601613.1 hypothetical protein [Stieleria sp. JC731]